MRNKLILIVVTLLITVTSFYVVSSKEAEPEEVMMIFLEKLLTATPETDDEIFHINILGRLDIDTYTINNYSDIATERMMIYMLENRLIGYSSSVALETSSNINVQSVEITSTQTSDGKIYFNFKGITKIVSIDTSEVFEYPIVGQIGIKSVDGIPKVDTCRFYTIELLDHPFR